MERSAECQAEISVAVDSVKDMQVGQLREELSSREIACDDAQEGWMRKKLRYALQQEVLERHGHKETTAMSEEAKQDGAPATESGEAAAKPGRKRMDKTGTFQLELGEGGSIGREGSAKNKILSQVQDHKKPFTYDEFLGFTANALEWNPKTETFGANTRFPTLNAAANAWFSEFKNKAKIITKVGDEAAA